MQILRQIESLFRTGTSAGLSDGQLLDRFLQRRDEEASEAAFTALVDRHGPMVLRVCRQVLGNEEDARDASQAAFLVLARRAGSIGRRESVGCWTHGVALRVANKARVAAARRRAHERRGGEMVAGLMIENDSSIHENRELWAIVHEELGRLPEMFRAPLVLCYLEGLTQEQAAARLRVPLGTIQSRLARGRARIKERLEKRGLNASAAILGIAFANAPAPPAPPAWAEATVRMAIHPGRAGTLASATAELAEEVVRAMVLGRLKAGAAMILLALMLGSGALAWAAQRGEEEPPPPAAVDKVALTPREAPQPEPEIVERTIRGIVRDERGRPVAKAWVGDGVQPMADFWRVITALDQIREAKEPYRDDRGKPVPPGPLGKYYEYRDDSGNWQAVHPRDIRRYDPSRYPFGSPLPHDLVDTRKAFPEGLLEVRTAKGRWEMRSLRLHGEPADRTDADGRFSVHIRFTPQVTPARELDFASPDFRRRAVRVIWPDGPDRPIEVTVKPVRAVRAGVIESPEDRPEHPIEWRFFATDLPGGDGYYLDVIRTKGAFWAMNHDPEDPPDGPTNADGPRRIEAQLVAGHYRLAIWTSTLDRLVDLDIPEGDGPLDLPDIRLESFAWVKMLGRPAAEIEAVDLDGKPVKLADYRGQVVVLMFWGNELDHWGAMMDRLAEFRKRLKDQPLALLALHDASLPSVKAYRQAMAPILDNWDRATEFPFRLLLDRPPGGPGVDPLAPKAGQLGSGQTRDIYEAPASATFVIDKLGRLSFILTEDGLGFHRVQIGRDGSLDQKFEEDPGGDLAEPKYDAGGFAFYSLLRAVEDGLGLPLTPMPEAKPEPAKSPPKPAPTGGHRTATEGPLRITGTVVGLEGKPIAGATVSPWFLKPPEKAAKSDVDGTFTLVADPPGFLKVEAPGMATRTFATELRTEDSGLSGAENHWIIEPGGRISKPLRMGPGAVVTGRAVRDGQPVPGVPIVLHRMGSSLDESFGAHDDFYLGDTEASTDHRGFFRFDRVAAGEHQRYSVYARAERPGTLQVVAPRAFKAGPDGEAIDLKDLEVRPARALAGRVIFADRPSPPPGATILVHPDRSAMRFEPLDSSGRFAIHGIPDDGVDMSLTLSVEGKPRSVRLPGYHLSRKNQCRDPRSPDRLRGMLDRDITDLTILAEPGDRPDRFGLNEIDPAELADFNEAKAGPITGVPPTSDPQRR